jgi:integrase/recombinase XerD
MSTLSVHLEDYLKLRRQLGFKLRVPGSLLRSFVAFARQHGRGRITIKLALRWATHPPQISPVQAANRLGMVRRFASYLSAVDPRTEVPPLGLLPCSIRRRVPYLFQEQELKTWFETGRQDRSFKGTTCSTLFGLLATTGMRVGEALSLKQQDLHWKAGLVTIRCAKGNRHRIIPLHRSALEALQHYELLRDRVCPHPPNCSFFVTAKGLALPYNTVNDWFIQLRDQMGWRSDAGQRAPRLHDLRHYFAIRTLLNWYRSEADVERQLPTLASYLGHVHVRDTYWYLSAAPELLAAAAARWQQRREGR